MPASSSLSAVALRSVRSFATTVHDLPAAALLVPLLVVALAVMLWRLRTRGQVTGPALLVGAIACGYAVAVVHEVLLPLPLDAAADVPWHDYLNLRPLHNTEVSDMAENVVLFLPLGLLVPLLIRAPSVWRTVLWGFGVSLAIEVTQFVTDVTLGAAHAADVNDLIANTVGGFLGYVLFRLIAGAPALRNVVAALRWPGSPRPVTSTA